MTDADKNSALAAGIVRDALQIATDISSMIELGGKVSPVSMAITIKSMEAAAQRLVDQLQALRQAVGKEPLIVALKRRSDAANTSPPCHYCKHPAQVISKYGPPSKWLYRKCSFCNAMCCGGCCGIVRGQLKCIRCVEDDAADKHQGHRSVR